MNHLAIAIALSLSLASSELDMAGDAREGWNEVQWSQYLAEQKGWEADYVLPDRSRVDIYGDGVAWEVEWAHKQSQCFGQAMFYAASTGSRPGVWLLKRPGDERHYLRWLATIKAFEAAGVRFEFCVTEVTR